MIDAVNSLLNNAVDFYVGFQQARFRHRSVLESGDVRQLSPNFSRTVQDSGQTGLSLAGAAGSPTIWPDPRRIRPNLRPSSRGTSWIRLGSGQNGRISSRIPAESLASPAGILLEQQDPGHLSRTACFRSIGRDPAILCRISARIPAKIAGTRHDVSNIKNYFSIILY
jgi:hypothetical protein